MLCWLTHAIASCLLESRSVPNVEQWRLASEKLPAACGKADGLDKSDPGSFEACHDLLRAQIPEKHIAVVSATNNAPPIRRERHAPNGIRAIRKGVIKVKGSGQAIDSSLPLRKAVIKGSSHNRILSV